METQFTLDKRKWEMWELERAEYDCGTPLSIEYGVMGSGRQVKFIMPEPSTYLPPNFNGINPINENRIFEDIFIEPTSEKELERRRIAGKKLKELYRLRKEKQKEEQKKEDQEDNESWYEKKTDKFHGFRSEEDERKIALIDEANSLIILE